MIVNCEDDEVIVMLDEGIHIHIPKDEAISLASKINSYYEDEDYDEDYDEDLDYYNDCDEDEDY